jgi:hypothetical protein
MLRWQRRADSAPRAKVTTKDDLARAEIDAEIKRRKNRDLAEEWGKSFGGDD